MNKTGCLTLILFAVITALLCTSVFAAAETTLSGAELVGTKPIPWSKLALPAIAAVVFVIVGYAVRKRKK